jgi:lipid-A-disaccharide synthase-like uncharacterized protein
MNIKNENLQIIPYTATSISLIGRFFFMFLLYKNESTNNLSLLFSILNMSSSGLWLYYSISTNDLHMIIRTSTEFSLLSIITIYVIVHKIIHYPYQNQRQILPL